MATVDEVPGRFMIFSSELCREASSTSHFVPASR